MWRKMVRSMGFFDTEYVVTQNEEETEELGAALAKTLAPGMIVALRGGMGAGKTAIARGIARGLGFSGRVTSPTFAIVNEYLGDVPIFHFDLFRLSGADELFEIGFEDYMSRGGVLVIEWLENAEDACLPDVEVALAPVAGNDMMREIEIKRRSL